MRVCVNVWCVPLCARNYMSIRNKMMSSHCHGWMKWVGWIGEIGSMWPLRGEHGFFEKYDGSLQTGVGIMRWMHWGCQSTLRLHTLGGIEAPNYPSKHNTLDTPSLPNHYRRDTLGGM